MTRYCRGWPCRPRSSRGWGGPGSPPGAGSAGGGSCNREDRRAGGAPPRPSLRPPPRALGGAGGRLRPNSPPPSRTLRPPSSAWRTDTRSSQELGPKTLDSSATPLSPTPKAVLQSIFTILPLLPPSGPESPSSPTCTSTAAASPASALLPSPQSRGSQGEPVRPLLKASLCRHLRGPRERSPGPLGSHLQAPPCSPCCSSQPPRCSSGLSRALSTRTSSHCLTSFSPWPPCHRSIFLHPWETVTLTQSSL